MRLIKNRGGDRVVDELRQGLVPLGTLDIAPAAFSLFAFAEVRELLSQLDKCRLIQEGAFNACPMSQCPPAAN